MNGEKGGMILLEKNAGTIVCHKKVARSFDPVLCRHTEATEINRKLT
jgi:hypothetical protein